MINMFRSKAGASLTGAEAAALYDAKNVPVEVKYDGFLGPVVREFPNAERAVLWTRSVGKYTCTNTIITVK
jgi:hypothetical protein